MTRPAGNAEIRTAELTALHTSRLLTIHIANGVPSFPLENLPASPLRPNGHLDPNGNASISIPFPHKSRIKRIQPQQVCDCIKQVLIILHNTQQQHFVFRFLIPAGVGYLKQQDQKMIFFLLKGLSNLSFMCFYKTFRSLVPLCFFYSATVKLNILIK